MPQHKKAKTPFVVRAAKKIGIEKPLQFLKVYPPFVFMGAKILEHANGGRHLKMELPLRWYSRNLHGTMFGGFMAAVADPLPALMLAEIFPGTEVWSKSQKIDFLKPGASHLLIEITVTPEQENQIRSDLKTTGKSLPGFSFDLVCKDGTVAAHVENTVFIRTR